MGQLRRWWSAKYHLPPNDLRFEGQSVGELLAEVWSDGRDQKAAARAPSFLGEEPRSHAPDAEVLPYDRPHLTGDPWSDEYELAIARGEEPNL